MRRDGDSCSREGFGLGESLWEEKLMPRREDRSTSSRRRLSGELSREIGRNKRSKKTKGKTRSYSYLAEDIFLAVPDVSVVIFWLIVEDHVLVGPAWEAHGGGEKGPPSARIFTASSRQRTDTRFERNGELNDAGVSEWFCLVVVLMVMWLYTISG
jgi:hypothetical protein